MSAIETSRFLTVREILFQHNIPAPISLLGLREANREIARCEQHSPAHLSSARHSPLLDCEPSVEALTVSYDYLVRQESFLLNVDPSFRDDVRQEGRISLILSAHQYDQARGNSFAAYARVCVRRSMLDFVKWIQRDSTRQQKAAATLAFVVTAREAHPSFYNRQEQTQSARPENVIILAEGIDTLNVAFHELPERQRTIIWLHYMDNWSLRQISRELHISTTRTHQLLKKGVDELRRKCYAL